ncbi:hypothetical protein HIM_05363 [Hirsutella minnesotensis 3608]|uniref:Uncharacterized protein n=1 Tax=Hirsutella minnesotensis 3608 TaxID=1043627 RepID=A0A0F8A5E1_9HYPO|nr:hypothetical protein HIM_05363 [Hirsutella minnesotensis 3608]
MQFNILSLLAVAAPLALAAPVDDDSLVARQLPNIGAILSDHNKYVANPAEAKVPIPAAENDPVREGHRQVHAALGSAAALVPGMPA